MTCSENISQEEQGNMDIPSQKCERLLVFEQILQAHLVVHDGLQAFDAPGYNGQWESCLHNSYSDFSLVLHFVPFGIVSEAFVEDRQHLQSVVLRRLLL